MSAWIAAMVALVCLLRECRPFTMKVVPSYQQIQNSEVTHGEYRFLCFDGDGGDLLGCHVKNLTGNNNKVFDLASRSTKGPGIIEGTCGFIAFHKGAVNAVLQYGCRIQSNSTPQHWEYGTTVVHVVDSNYVDGVLGVAKTPPAQIEVMAGTEVNLEFAANESLWKCEFKWPGQSAWVSEGFSNAYEFDNSGLHQGRCGITLRNVSGEQSGIVTTRLISKNNTDGKHREYIHLTTLIVILAPRALVQLSLSESKNVYNEGDVMRASCHVGLARPVAQVTWLLNGDVISDNSKDFKTWPWDYEAANVTRYFHRRLLMTDDGKELVCRVHNVGLPGGVVEARTNISVRISRECGLRAGPGKPRYAGWNLVRFNEFPWHLSVFSKQEEWFIDRRDGCTGTLVSLKYFVTAAHCFERGNLTARSPRDLSRYTVVAGKAFAIRRSTGTHEQLRGIKKIHIHENFDGYNKNLEADIAVVEVDTPFESTQSVNVVCMDWMNVFADQKLAAGNLATLPVWAHTLPIQYVDFPVISNAECKALVPSDFQKYLVQDKFCAGYDTNVTHFFCSGNEGGGFVTPISTDSGVRYYLMGIVSISPRVQPGRDNWCKEENVIALTKMSTYIDWVKGIVFAEKQ